MKIAELLKSLDVTAKSSSSNFEIERITSQSGQAGPNSVFVAIAGTKRDGHQFLSEASHLGCSAVIVSRQNAVPPEFTGWVIVVDDTRSALERALHLFWNEPSSKMTCIGVTGTNGKTSSTNMIEAIFNDQGLPTAVMGTIDHHLGSKKFDTDLTTPGPELLYQRMAEFVALGAKALAIEVSSHALSQRRADSVNFDVGLFTNLTRDHLDYHSSMMEYFATKERLFDELLWHSTKADKTAVINFDDEYGRRLRIPDLVRTISFGQSKSDIVFDVIEKTFAGMRVQIDFEGRRYILDTSLIGIHNAYNLAGAFGVAAACRRDLDRAISSLSKFEGVKGRLERVANRRGLYAFVDYAHTDDALKNVLSSLKSLRDEAHPEAKILTVFGCGGDRDRGKRPLMARVAEEFSDFVIVTSDNPRTEEPSAIISEVVAGFSSAFLAGQVHQEVDRRRAIAHALKTAQTGDVVLIAGKGHEDYQILGTKKIHFSDVEAVKELA